MKQSFTIRNEGIRRSVIDWILGLPLTDVWEVVVKPYRKNRSNQQNSLMWLWYDLIREHIEATTGENYTSEQIHEHFKAMFLTSTVVAIGGDKTTVYRSTAKLKTVEFTDYLEKIDMYCAEKLSLILPHPGDEYHEMQAARMAH